MKQKKRKRAKSMNKEDPEGSPDEATNPSKNTGDSKDLKFDLRDHNASDLGPNEQMEAVFKELKAQREILEELQENGHHKAQLDLSSLSKFQVTNDGEPTKEAEELRKKVVSNGKEGLTTKDMEGLLDCSNPTATSKMEQMAEAFDDLELYNPRENKKKPRYNQPKRLRHRKIAIGEKEIKEVLQEDHLQEMVKCNECGARASRKAFKRNNWKCLQSDCEAELPEVKR